MPVCFANISATKAQIFMNFYMVVNYYLVSFTFKFHEDLRIDARTQVINTCTRDKNWARACLQLLRAHLCTDIHKI